MSALLNLSRLIDRVNTVIGRWISWLILAAVIISTVNAIIRKVFDQSSSVGLPNATVSCRWSGFDDVLGTADDVVFTVTAKSDGTFDLSGVPYGEFRCTGLDTASGRSSAPAVASVRSAVAVRAPLPVGEVAPVALAFTGVATGRTLVLTLVLLLLGVCGEIVLHRTRRTRRV